MTLILLVVGLRKKRLLDAGSPVGRANDLMAGPGPAADPAAVAPDDHQLTLVDVTRSVRLVKPHAAGGALDTGRAGARSIGSRPESSGFTERH